MKKIFVICLIFIFLSVSCSNEASSSEEKDESSQQSMNDGDIEDETENTPQLTEAQMKYSDEQAELVDTELVRRNNLFALNLLRKLRNNYSESNLFFSPLSISTAFAMAYAGSSGQTAEEIAMALEFGDYSPKQLSDKYKVFLESLMYVDNAAYLAFANSLWTHQNNVRVFESYRETLQEKYFSDVFSFLPDPKEEGVEKINKWIEEKTFGKIKDMIDSVPGGALFYLINAVYFYGGWKTPFDESETRESYFNVDENRKVKVPMMSKTGLIDNCTVSNDDGTILNAVRMGYGRDKMAMYFFRTFDLESVTPEGISECVSSISRREFMFEVPRFSFEWGTFNLNDILSEMGLERFFDAPDFTENMIEWWSGGTLCVNRVLHKAFVSVDETGTVAAAATAIEGGAKSSPPSFTLDRPFFFMIVDERTNAILFIGFLKNPDLDGIEDPGKGRCL